MAIKKAFCYGEVLWDCFPDSRKLGGAPFNVAHSLNQDFDVTLVSAVGNDQNGSEILEVLQREGIPTDGVAILPDHPTGTVTVHLDKLGIPTYEITENVAWDFIPKIDNLEEAASSIDILYYGSLVMRHKSSFRNFKSLQSKLTDSCLKVCDLNLRQNYCNKELLKELLDTATHLKLNDEELTIIFDSPFEELNIEEALHAVIENYFLKGLVLTMGSKGSYMLNHSGQFNFTASRKVKLINTVGAGDAFTARWIKGLLLEEDFLKMHAASQEAGSKACERAGAVELKS